MADQIAYVVLDAGTPTLVSVNGQPVGAQEENYPVATLGINSTLVIRPLKSNGYAPYTLAELQEYTAWEFSVTQDYDQATEPLFSYDVGTPIAVRETVDGSVTYGEIVIKMAPTTATLETFLQTDVKVYKTNTTDNRGNDITVGMRLAGLVPSDPNYPEIQADLPFLVRNNRYFNGPTTVLPPNAWTPAQIQAYSVPREVSALSGGGVINLTNDKLVLYQDGSAVSVTGQEFADEITQAGDEKVKVSATDTTTGYLDDKVKAGVGLSELIVNPGADEEKQISLANTTVTPGSYTSADVTIDAQGRITAAGNGTTAAALTVKDSITTVNSVSLINFSGGVVSDDGAGAVTITITGGGGGESNTASNVGTGVGIFKQKNGVDLEFNNIKSVDTDNIISVSLNASNNDVELNVSSTNLNTFISNNSAVSLNTAKTTNATHTGDMSGSGVLTALPAIITGKPAVANLTGTEDIIVVAAGTLYKAKTQYIADLAGGGGGGLGWSSTEVKTADYTIVTGDAGKKISLGTGASGTITFDLPTTPADGFSVSIENQNSITTDPLKISDGTDDLKTLDVSDGVAFCIYSTSTSTWTII